MFVANDAMPNQLWINRGEGRFEDEALVRGTAVDEDGAAKSGMGVDAKDVDGDGDEDLLVVNLDGESDSLFRNDGAFFSDATAVAGLRAVSRPFTRFGTASIDFDNDGWLDLYQANGRVGQQSERLSETIVYAEPSLLLRGVERRPIRRSAAARRHVAAAHRLEPRRGLWRHRQRRRR